VAAVAVVILLEAIPVGATGRNEVGIVEPSAKPTLVVAEGVSVENTPENVAVLHICIEGVGVEKRLPAPNNELLVDEVPEGCFAGVSFWLAGTEADFDFSNSGRRPAVIRYFNAERDVGAARENSGLLAWLREHPCSVSQFRSSLAGFPQLLSRPPKRDRGEEEKPGEESNVGLSIIKDLRPNIDERKHNRAIKSAYIFFYALIGGAVFFHVVAKCRP
jgi:hypothetical protein